MYIKINLLSLFNNNNKKISMKKLKNKNFTSFPALILLNLIFFSCLNIVFTTNFLHDESEDKNFSFEEIVTRKGYLYLL